MEELQSPPWARFGETDLRLDAPVVRPASRGIGRSLFSWGFVIALIVGAGNGVGLRSSWGSAIGWVGASYTDPRGFTYLRTQRYDRNTPVGYDPCQRIDVVINPTDGPPQAQIIVQEAVDTIAGISGLHLRVVGTTDESAVSRWASTPAVWDRSPVLVDWTTRAKYAELSDQAIGRGGSISATTITGKEVYVTGAVALDGPYLRAALLRPNGRHVVRMVVMHELGHVLGLGHIERAGEIMSYQGTPLSPGPGDRAGLQSLGQLSCGIWR